MKALLQGGLGWALGGIVAAALVLGVLLAVWTPPGDAPAPVADLPETSGSETETAETGADSGETEEAAAPAETDAVQAPSFDVVRVSPNGSTVVAGFAAPDALVEIRVDGAPVAEAQADGSGNFVALFDLPLADRPRVMQLALASGDTETLSEESFIVEPMPEPVEMAEAEPEATTGEADADESAEEVAEAAPSEPSEPTVPRVLKADEEGIEVVSDSQSAEALSLDTIAYDEGGEVEVAGRASAGSVLRLYLDNALQGDVTADGEGRWAMMLAGVAPGIYTLRVDALAADGQVAQRVESPFKREDPVALAAVSSSQSGTPGTAPETPAEPDAPLSETAPETGEATETTMAAADTDSAPEAPTDGDAPVTGAAPEGADMASAPEPATGDAAPKVRVITVQPGTTLWAIARERYGDGVLYVQVFEANRDKIRDPDLIYPGQVFELPE